MASVTIAGTVVCKEGQPAVTVKTFDSGDQLATFTVMDRAYVYTRPGEDRTGQFYNCQVRGKGAEIAAERIQRNDKIAVTGQLVQREYNGRTFLDVRNASPTYLEYRPNEGGTGGRTSSTDEIPF